MVKSEKEMDQAEFDRINQENLNKELEKSSQPFWLTKAFVNKTWIVITTCGIIFFICTIITITQKHLEMSENGDRDYLIWSNSRVEDYDIYEKIKENFQKSLLESQIPERSLEISDWSTYVVYQCKSCETLFTVENLKIIYEAEQKIQNQSDYKNFCLADTTSPACSKDALFSFTKEFSDIENLTQQQIDEKINKLTTDDSYFDDFKGLFDNKFNKDGNTKVKLMRSIFKFGGPLNYKGTLYSDNFDREDDQKKHFESFSEKILKIIRDKVTEPKGGEILVWSDIIQDVETQKVADRDFLWAIGSIIFVWIYITIHLRSLFLGSTAMFNILMSFPITLFFFREVLRITYFSSLHILVVFIVLGIAADNVFVFTDAWQQTEHYQQLEGDYNKRMAVTFRRASKSMLATSSTTGAAFLATGLSPIMPISSFGFFAGILIPVNFILVITFYPAILICFEKYTKNMFDKCLKKNENKSQVQDQENQENKESKDQEKPKKLTGKQKIEHFFGNQFNNFTNKGKYPIIIFFTIWTGIAIWRTAKLPALSEPEQFLPDEFDVQKASKENRYNFHVAGNSDTGIKVFQYWGAKSISRDGVGMWDSKDVGKVKYDDEFNLAPETNQKYLFDLCTSMKTNKIVQDGDLECFMLDFQKFITNQQKTFPVPEANFITELKAFAKDTLGQPFYNDNQIGLQKDELKYVYVSYSSHGIPFQPYKILNPKFKEWDKFIKEENKRAPVGMNRSKQTARINWVFMITEQAFVSSALQGTFISLVFAFVVLMIVTHNIIVGLYSTLTIGGIVLSIIALMEMQGWELGVAESVGIVILIGMSVDYVVHLANHYVECAYEDKHKKMQLSLEEIGISIISGASTTIGSGIFLFFATLTIFTKFAILIVSTICFSLVYALIFFSALIHAFGPEGNMGSLIYLFGLLKSKVCKIQPQKEEKDEAKLPQDVEQQTQLQDVQQEVQQNEQQNDQQQQ